MNAATTPPSNTAPTTYDTSQQRRQNNDLVYEDTDFWVQAEQAATAAVRTTVRHVLRQMAVQALGQCIVQKQQQQQQRTSMVITTADISAVQQFCQRTAEKWSAACRAVGHETMATSITEVAYNQTAVDLLWYTDSEEDKDDATTHAATDEEIPTTTPTAAAAASQTLTTTTTTTPPKKTYHTVWGRLYQELPQLVAAAASANKEVPPLQVAIDQLDAWGKQQQTYWPNALHSWRHIQETAANIPYRLYKNNLPTTVEVVPVAEEGTTITTSHPQRTAADWLLDRKRKSTGRERLPPRRMKPKWNPPPDPPPRPPSLVHQQVQRLATGAALQKSLLLDYGATDLQQLLVPQLQQQQQQQEQSDHDTTATTESSQSPQSLIVGGLCDLGQWHYCRQDPVDHTFNVSFRKVTWDHNPHGARRHRQRKAVQERLGDHTADAATDYGARTRGATVSKVQATRCGTTAWRDADLQHVLLEVVEQTPHPETEDGSATTTTATPRRHLLALASLECLLLDEATVPSESWHDLQIW